jgi:thiamine kinase-like enzyme
MLPAEIERLAARHVPGRGKLDIHPLRIGLVNETYRVLRDGGVYALRVAAGNPAALGLDRAWEARVLESAVLAGLAPALAYCDPRRGILVAHWVDGRPWSPAEVRQPSSISRMAALIHAIHALPMPAPPRLMSPLQWIDRYSAACKVADGGSGSAAATGGAAAAASAALRGAAGQRLAELAALPGVDPVVCHSDLHTLNLIDTGRSLVLLDWEYAHAADPLWDLASWSANNDLAEEAGAVLLASYFGRAPTGDESRRLGLLIWLYDYICLLWSGYYLSLGLSLRRDARPDVAAHAQAAGHTQAAGDTEAGAISARAELLAARLRLPEFE